MVSTHHSLHNASTTQSSSEHFNFLLKCDFVLHCVSPSDCRDLNKWRMLFKWNLVEDTPRDHSHSYFSISFGNNDAVFSSFHFYVVFWGISFVGLDSRVAYLIYT